MAYIIDEAKVLKGNGVEACSIFVKNNKIDFIRENANRFRSLKMNVNSFIVTPGHVMLDLSLSTSLPFQLFKQHLRTHFLMKGCTTILVICKIPYENQLINELNKVRGNLVNSPIDYYIGVQISLKTLTPSFVRACKRNKIPVILVEIEHEDDLFDVQWGWIREALFLYPIVFIPVWQNQIRPKQEQKKLTKIWNHHTSTHKIPTIVECPQEGRPLSKEVLTKIGIYPAKGDIRVGGEVDYNLYNQEDQVKKVAQKAFVDYHNHNPAITVHKGVVIKSGDKIDFRPGFGNECSVKIPGYFSAPT
ncbi:hypothetical protein V1503_17200 [Bacillus sp. SCS-151]|uniref:hypothetical protein n=1 Tax=Nanhaiella sioensis TaxID=3115293 RepID=UPI003978861D